MWDMDVATPVVLYDPIVNGQLRQGFATLRIDGYLFLLDRATGAPLLPTEERPVKQDPRLFTAPTQPFPVGADQLVRNCVDPLRIAPGYEGHCFFDPIHMDSAQYDAAVHGCAPGANGL
jgi:glucose dehydrogenase